MVLHNDKTRYSRVFTLRCDFMPSALMKGSNPNCHNDRVLLTLAAGSGGAHGIKSRLYVTHAILRQCFTPMRRSTPNCHNYRALPTLVAGSGGAFSIKFRLYVTHTQRECSGNASVPEVLYTTQWRIQKFGQGGAHSARARARNFSYTHAQFRAWANDARSPTLSLKPDMATPD